jgi:hypothetical protein
MRKEKLWPELRKYVPNRESVRADVDQFVQQSLSDDWIIEEPNLDEIPLTNEEEARMRYNRTFVRNNYPSWGPRWGVAFTLYLDLMPQDVRLEVLKFLSKFRVLPKDYFLWSLFRGWSLIGKKHGRLFSKFWKWYVNLDVLGGYKQTVDIDMFVEDIRDWATGDSLHELPDRGGDMSNQYFLSLFRVGVRQFLHSGRGSVPDDKTYTIQQWAERPGLWARSGATSMRVAPEFEEHGERIRPK